MDGFLQKYLFRKILTVSVILFLGLGLARPNLIVPLMSGLSALSEKPKPRPRGIIKTQVKSPNHIIKKAAMISAVIPNSLSQVTIIVGAVTLTEKPHLISCGKFPHRSNRAPPALS